MARSPRSDRVGKSKSRHGRRQSKPAVTTDLLSEIADVRIDHLGRRGDGAMDYKGRTVSIPLSAPGDLVRVRIAGDQGWIEEILTPGPDRSTPPCDLFGSCGGCTLQHLSDDFQSEWKSTLVSDALAREGVAVPWISPSPVFPAASRRRATLSVHRTGKNTQIGFNARRTHRIVEMTYCHILTPALFSVVSGLKEIVEILPKSWTEFSIKITQCDNGFDLDILAPRGRAFDIEEIRPASLQALGPLMHSRKIKRISVNSSPVLFLEPLIVHFDSIAVDLPPGAFLQASQCGQAALLETVRSVLSRWTIKRGSRIADLFTGCGAFSLPLARDYQLSAFDNDQPGIAALNQAARRTPDLRPVTAQERDLFRQPLFADEADGFNVVIFDPPRAGAPAQVKQLIQSRVPYLIGVSCNPASFARDARILAKGGYSIDSLQLIDQFTYSPHVELVAGFVKQ